MEPIPAPHRAPASLTVLLDLDHDHDHVDHDLFQARFISHHLQTNHEAKRPQSHMLFQKK